MAGRRERARGRFGSSSSSSFLRTAVVVVVDDDVAVGGGGTIVVVEAAETELRRKEICEKHGHIYVFMWMCECVGVETGVTSPYIVQYKERAWIHSLARLG